MFDIIELFKFYTIFPNFFLLMRLIFIFCFLILFGIAVLYKAGYITTNKLLLVGQGMIIGPLFFLLFLSIIPYLIKGYLGIFISAGICGIWSAVFILNQKQKLNKLLSYRFYLWDSITIPFLAVFLVLVLLYTGNTIIGGDVMSQWPLATSFANGNYPTMLPWQPNQISGYHQGTFMLLGALHVLTGISIDHIHYFFSAYVLWAIILLLTGIMKEKTRSPLVLVPALFAIIVCGPIFLITDLWPFVASIVKINHMGPTYFRDLAQFPNISDVKAYIGAGASSLALLIFLNFITFGLGTLLVLIDLILKDTTKGILAKYIFLVTISILLFSVNEAMAIVTVPLIFILLLVDIKSIDRNKAKLAIIFKLMMLAALMFITIQNPIRDSFLSPAKEMPRFKILSTTDRAAYADEPEYALRKRFLGGEFSKNEDKFGKWYIPNLLVFSLLLCGVGFYVRDKLATTIALVAGFSGIAGLTILNTFWPPNALRFITQGYQLSIIASGILLVKLCVSKKISTKTVGVILCATFIPVVVSTTSELINGALTGSYSFFKGDLIYKNESLSNVKDIVPFQKKILFIDGYPTKTQYSPLTMAAITQYGMFVPLVKPEPKVVNVDYAADWFDAVTYLSPPAIKKLGSEYLFIQRREESRLSDQRRKDLYNSKLFSKKYEDKNGALYLIKDRFKAMDDSENTVISLASKIPDAARVFLDKYQLAEIRRGLILELSKRAHVISNQSLIGRDNDTFLFIETKLPIDSDLSSRNLSTIQYAIIDNTLPTKILNLEEYNEIGSNKFITLLKKK